MDREEKSLISIIIPVYNNAGTLQRCLASVCSQTMRNIEILVVDDGSTDETPQILRALAAGDARIRTFRQENRGQGEARNHGMREARGTYLGFVDADDVVDAEMYEGMLRAAERTDVDVVQCNIIDVFPDGRFMLQMPGLDKWVKIEDRKNYFEEYLFHPKHSFECCNKLIRKNFLTEHGIVFEDNKKVFAEDLLFNLQVAARMNAIVFVSNPFYYYYQYPDSYSRKDSIDRMDKLCVLFDLFYGQVEELRPVTAKIAVLILMIHLSHILDRPEGVKKARSIFARPQLRSYLWQSVRSMKRLRHKLLMLAIYAAPFPVKLRIVRFYYTRLK